VTCTPADSWLTELKRTNSTSPWTIARRRDASCRSNAVQSVIVTAAFYPNLGRHFKPGRCKEKNRRMKRIFDHVIPPKLGFGLVVKT
jgi:hypothetical protein